MITSRDNRDIDVVGIKQTSQIRPAFGAVVSFLHLADAAGIRIAQTSNIHAVDLGELTGKLPRSSSTANHSDIDGIVSTHVARRP